jgi:DtxR family Mn-dependent transcriptional regulator
VVADGYHPPVEEYLHAVYDLEEDGVPVIRARIAERLGYSAPSVTEMVRRLVDEGYLRVQNRSLRLTTKGRELAESVVRRHRLAERLLTDVIGLEWYKAHREAGRWEHVISDDVEEKLRALLGNPVTCPHGNPIPGEPRPPALATMRPLTACEVGERVRIDRVNETLEWDYESLAYLDDHGVRPGAVLEIRSRAPDGTLTVRAGADTVALSPALAANLFTADASEEGS